MEYATWLDTFQRLCTATGATSEAGLATAMGMSHQAVYEAKKKVTIPPKWIITVAQQYDVSADWLLSGRGAMRQGEESVQQGTASVAPAAAHTACPQCLELYAKLETANERLYQASERERALLLENSQLKEEIGKIHEELAVLKNTLPDEDETDLPLANAS